MSKYVKMTECRYESEVTESWIRGQGTGLEQAARIALEHAGRYFKNGDDDNAKLFRLFSKDLLAEAEKQKERAEEHEREYSKTEPKIEEIDEEEECDR